MRPDAHWRGGCCVRGHNAPSWWWLDMARHGANFLECRPEHHSLIPVYDLNYVVSMIAEKNSARSQIRITFEMVLERQANAKGEQQRVRGG